jgi:predicted nucleotidyltransferase
MDNSTKQKLTTLFKKYREIKLVYLFGSRARGDAGPMSDYDFAVYADTRDLKKLGALQLSLINKISSTLATNDVDVVMLNTLAMPEMKYAIISEGILFYEKKPYTMIVEPNILNEYFDFRLLLERHGLSCRT